MMQFWKIILYGLLATILVACATSKNEDQLTIKNYKNAGGSVAPARIPPNLSADKIRNAYPIPAGAEQVNGSDVSLVPPGSNLQQYEKKPTASNTQAATANVSAQQATNNTLTIAMNYNQAWKQVGISLAQGGLQIMDKDSGLGTYYVLDKATTGGVIKQDTPIYQVHLEEAGNTTTINVLDSHSRPTDAAEANRILAILKNKLGGSSR